MSIQTVMDRGDFLQWAEGWFHKDDLLMTDLGGFLDWRVEACFDAWKESRKLLAKKEASQ